MEQVTHNHSTITVIYGPMFSGKSTELMRRVRRYKAAKRICLVINHTMDERYSEKSLVKSHDGSEMDAFKTNDLEKVPRELLEKCSVIAIDEAQFFAGLVRFSELWKMKGKYILLAGLNLNFRRDYFPEMLHLMSRADKMYHLTAKCVKCGGTAAFSHRKTESTELFMTGGSDMYEALCGRCFPIPESDTVVV